MFGLPGATVWNGSDALPTHENGPAGCGAVATPKSCGVLPSPVPRTHMTYSPVAAHLIVFGRSRSRPLRVGDEPLNARKHEALVAPIIQIFRGVKVDAAVLAARRVPAAVPVIRARIEQEAAAVRVDRRARRVAPDFAGAEAREAEERHRDQRSRGHRCWRSASREMSSALSPDLRLPPWRRSQQVRTPFPLTATRPPTLAPPTQPTGHPPIQKIAGLSTAARSDPHLFSPPFAACSARNPRRRRGRRAAGW